MKSPLLLFNDKITRFCSYFSRQSIIFRVPPVRECTVIDQVNSAYLEDKLRKSTGQCRR